MNVIIKKCIENDWTYTKDCYQKSHTDFFLLLIDVNTFEIFMLSQVEWPGLMYLKCICVGEQRQATRTAGYWHFHHHGVYSLAALDLTSMHAGLFDICLVVLYIRSANWILVFLFLFVLVYYFCFWGTELSFPAFSTWTEAWMRRRNVTVKLAKKHWHVQFKNRDTKWKAASSSVKRQSMYLVFMLHNLQKM